MKSEFWAADCADAVAHTPEEAAWRAWKPGREPADVIVRGYARAQATDSWPGGYLEPTGETQTYSAEYFR